MQQQEFHITSYVQEYQTNGTFLPSVYTSKGDETRGWNILNADGSEKISLGPGYSLIKVVYCGVCRTDFSRENLPFPLPQVTGHEVVGYKWKGDSTIESEPQYVVVEINASHFARGISSECKYCDPKGNIAMNRQCPGIDRLPGGFAQFLLAPIHSIIDVPKTIRPLTAVLCEPFAAALEAVECTPPSDGYKVAVLGPRKLGLLIIAALKGFRNRTKISFEITAIARHDNLLDIAKKLGADKAINNAKESHTLHSAQFDILFDTTGSPSGFQTALQLTKRTLHLKSTSGAAAFGIKHWTQLVVDELAIMEYSPHNLDFTWPKEGIRRNPNVLLSPSLSHKQVEKVKSGEGNFRKVEVTSSESTVERTFIQMEVTTACERLQKDSQLVASSPYPRFDVAIVSSMKEVDSVIRPLHPDPFSPLRARGVILVMNDEGYSENDELKEAVMKRHVEIRTSRCGDFRNALDLLEHNPDLADQLEENIITHKFNLKDINECFNTARDFNCLKCVVSCQNSF